MKFTLDWLLDHIDIESGVSVGELSERLTALGVEVEDICDNSAKYDGMVIGRIERADRHPNADKLSVCEVNIGDCKILRIVCGAPNVRHGMYVIVSLPGAIIPATGLPLKRGTIRGIESEGMMCSAEELLLLDRFQSNGGIIDLGSDDNEFVLGTPMATSLGINDVIFNVSITPSRGDCMSVRGVAKLLSASEIGTLKNFESEDFLCESDKSLCVDVDIQTQNCLYFSTRVVEGITQLGETPLFIRKRLEAIGQKLIHPAVDIANYVCLDIGQPLHMFDLDKLPRHHLVIKDSCGREKLNTLDGKETSIPEGGIIICSDDQPLSIAGIMGGEPTGCSSSTKNVLIESAYFNKVAISITGQRLRINSDAKIRNERGIDPAIVDIAMDYATSLLKRVYPNCRVFETAKYGKLPENTNKISVSYKKFSNISGLSEIDWKIAAERLPRLGIQVTEFNSERMEVLTPSSRHDLSIEEDIIEDILILNGYDNILPVDIPRYNEPVTHEYVDEKLSDVLVHNGFNEIKTFSFVDECTCLLFADRKNLVQLLEPLTSEFAVLRPSAIASILKSLCNNQNRNQKDCKFFEIGRRFNIIDEKIKEDNMFSIAISGMSNERGWQNRQTEVSVFDIKRIVEKMFAAVDMKKFRVKQGAAPSYYHPGRSGAYTFNKNEIIAYFGEIHPTVLKRLGIDLRVVCAEVFLDVLPKYVVNKVPKQITLSPFQTVSRDFSFVVDDSVEAQKVVDAIKAARIDELRKVSVFDVYKLDNSQKAVGIEVILQSDNAPISDEAITKISKAIIKKVEDSCAGILRS